MILHDGTITYMLIYLVIPAVLLYDFRLAADEKWYFSKKNTESLRGITITGIVIHHLVSGMDNPGLLTPFIGIGYLGVSIFLFLSGFGLTSSYLYRVNYLNGFFSKRMTKIFVPVILLNIIHLIINTGVFSINYSPVQFFSLALGIELINGTMWYINAILFWYICFFTVFRYFQPKSAEKLILAAAVLYFIFCYKFNLGKYWFDSTYSFPAGVLFCLRKDGITHLIKRYFNYLAVVSTCLFAAFFVLNQGKTSLISISMRSAASVVFVLLICLLMYKVDMSRSRVLTFLGSISFEIYLIHARLLGFNIISQDNKIGIFNVLFYFTLTIISAYFLNKFNLIVNTIVTKAFLRRGNVLNDTIQ